MIGDIKLTYCPICDADTDHLQGCFKCKNIDGELFDFDVLLSDSLKKVSSGYREFVLEEHNGLMDSDAPGEYVETKKGGLNFEELFASQVRSLKCTQCLHLIKISRFP